MKHDPDAFTQPWKHIPNLGHAAAWLICELCEAGSLPGRLLGQVIPISLTLIDDLEDAFTLLGCSTLLKLSSTCTQTELRWHTVPIFDCLERALRKDSKEIVAKVMSTQIQICPLLETRGHRPRFDSTVDLIVSLSIRTVDANKGAFVCGIRDFIRASGLSIVRHLRTLVPFLLDIVSKGAIDGSGEYALNPKERDALETLSVLLCVAWPRRATFVDAITYALLRATIVAGGERDLPFIRRAAALLKFVTTDSNGSPTIERALTHVALTKLGHLCGALSFLSLRGFAGGRFPPCGSGPSIFYFAGGTK